MQASLHEDPKTFGPPRHTTTYCQRMDPNPNRKQPRPYRRPSMFPWWLWIVAPLAVIAVVAVALIVG
jgi:hypothetical protein